MREGSHEEGTMGRTAIMQPYFFPYLGYFQLLHSCDRFVSLDDAAFIKKGWINRNNVLLNGAAHLITIPIRGLSQNISIRESVIAPDDGWKRKLQNTITHAYRKAPCYEQMHPLIASLVQEAEGSMADLAQASIELVLSRVDMRRTILRSSEMELAPELHGKDRIIAICEVVGTSTYINPSGGRELYKAEDFEAKRMELRFIAMQDHQYDQGGSSFVGGLSMIDVLMWNTPEQALALLGRYSLTP